MKQKIIEAKGVARPTRDTRRLINLSFLHYAKEFHHAASRTRSILVRSYLLGHALELYLKIFLLKSGMTVADLKNPRKFGHKLDRLLSEAETHGIGKLVRISEGIRQDLLDLNEFYSAKALQYFTLLQVFNNPTIPPLARLFRFARLLRDRLETMIWEEPLDH